MMSPNNEAADTTTDANDTAEFDSAFAEFSGTGNDAGSQGAEAADVEKKPDATEADGAQGDSGTSGAAAAGQGGAEGAAAEGAAQATAGTEGAAAAQAAADIWATATEEQREAYRKLEQSWRSDAGRIAAFQRQANEVKAELAALRAAASSGKRGNETRPQVQEDPEFAALRSEFPEIAEPLLKHIQAERERADRLEKRISEFDKQALETEYTQQRMLLEQEHPDWAIATSQPAFAEWLGRQPQYVVEAVQRNGQQIVNAVEAADIIGRFKASQPSLPAPVPQPAPASTSQSDASRDNARRQRQLSSGVGPSKGAGPGAGPADSFDDAFAYYANQEDPRRSAARR